MQMLVRAWMQVRKLKLIRQHDATGPEPEPEPEPDPEPRQLRTIKLDPNRIVYM